MSSDIEYYGTIFNIGVKENAPYVRFTLIEPVDMEIPADDGGSGVRNYKVLKIKYIDVPCEEIEELYSEEEPYSRKLSEDDNGDNSGGSPNVLKEGLYGMLNSGRFPPIDKSRNDYVIISSTNIASADVRVSYPDKRSRLWHKYKEKGKKFIKVFGIILGFVLAITQIVINIVTLSPF